MKNTLLVVGVVLAVLGALGLVLETVSWNEERTLVDIGEFEASATVQESRTISPVLAGGVLVAGLVLTAVGVARKS